MNFVLLVNDCLLIVIASGTASCFQCNKKNSFKNWHLAFLKVYNYLRHVNVTMFFMDKQTGIL